MELTVRAPQTESEWTAYYDLRFRVLRQPWGQPIGSERDNSEDNAYHFALYNEATLIAVVRLDEKNKGELFNAQSGAPFSYSDPCVQIGAHIGHKPESTEQTVKSVVSFLQTL